MFVTVVNLSPSLLVQGWAFRGNPFHTQSWYFHLLPMKLLTCGMFQTGVFGDFPAFQSFDPPVTTFLEHTASIKLKKSIYWSIYPPIVFLWTLLQLPLCQIRLSHWALFGFYICFTTHTETFCLRRTRKKGVDCIESGTANQIKNRLWLLLCERKKKQRRW